MKGTCCGDWVMCHDGEGKVAFGMTWAAPLRLTAPVKKKKQEMTCAEPPKLSPLRPTAPVKKKKARNDVCGAAQAIHKLPHSTLQKEKSKKWRVRSRPSYLQAAM